MSSPVNTCPLQTAIELACAAARANDSYIKDGQIEIEHKYSNKELMLVALGAIDPKKYEDLPHKPVLLCTNKEDQALATEMQKFFKRLLFTAIDGTDTFKSDLFTVLSNDTVPISKLGFIAYLPYAYVKDRYQNQITKASAGYLANIGSEVSDLDCEVLRCTRSKNFDAWNTDAIINDKVVSWMSKQRLAVGPCVLLTGKVKDHSKHWQHQHIDVTRLNYVKAFQ